MGKEAPSVTEALSELAKAGTAQLRICFPTKTVTQPGEHVSVAEGKEDPTLYVSTSALRSATGKYVAASIDLDAPFPSFSVLGPVLHGLQADLVASAGTADGDGDGDGQWTRLETEAKAVVFYAGPQPPKPSAAHRYVFLVWDQPEGMGSDEIKKVLGLPDQVGIPGRMRWDQQACEKKLGLGKVIAANYFFTKG